MLRKLRQFQDLGHKAVLIIGDYTALVGDPTGQNKTRPMLSDADIERNAKTYFDQAGKILDTSTDKLEIRRNGEWLAGMSLADVIRLDQPDDRGPHAGTRHVREATTRPANESVCTNFSIR